MAGLILCSLLLFQDALNATQDFRIYVGYPGLVYSPCHVNLTFQLFQLLLNFCSTHLQLNFLGFCFNIQQNWWYWLQLFFIHCLPSQPICYVSTSITSYYFYMFSIWSFLLTFFILVSPLVSQDSWRTLQCYDGLSIQSLLFLFSCQLNLSTFPTST